MSRYVVNNGKYQCNECNTAVGTRGGILKHWKVKHNPTFTPWNCMHCQRTFTSKYKFRKHDCTGKSYSTKDAVATFIQAIIEQEVEAPTPIRTQQDTEAIVQQEVEATTIIHAIVQQEVEAPTIIMQQDTEAIVQPEVEATTIIQAKAPKPIRTQQDTEAIVQQEVEATTIIQQDNEAIIQQEVEAPTPIRTQQDTEAIVQQEVEATTIIQQDNEVIELEGDEKITFWRNMTKSIKNMNVEELIYAAKSYHKNFDTTIEDFINTLDKMTFNHADHFSNKIEEVVSCVKKINDKHFQGVRGESWYKYFPLFRYLIHIKFTRIEIRTNRTTKKFRENEIPRDRRYQETNQLSSMLGVFIMIMMILFNTNIITKINEWFLFDVACVNLYLMVYQQLRADTTVARQREQIVWVWKQTFASIQGDPFYMAMNGEQIGFLARLRTRLDSCKVTLSGIYQRKMCFKSQCYKELIGKGSMITNEEELCLLMWLLNNLIFILSIWSKIENGDILNFPKPDKANQSYQTYITKVELTERKLYRKLIQDTQVVIGCILVIFLYGQRTQISNSLTIDILQKVPDVGLIVKPIYEKINRRATGLTLNNQLESILNWQIDVVRKKCNIIPGVTGLFLKRCGRPYTTSHWTMLTKEFFR